MSWNGSDQFCSQCWDNGKCGWCCYYYNEGYERCSGYLDDERTVKCKRVFDETYEYSH